MSTAIKIIKKLVEKGLIPPEHTIEAAETLERELRIRSNRIAVNIATAASRQVHNNRTANFSC